jgi:hypothetical protein
MIELSPEDDDKFETVFREDKNKHNMRYEVYQEDSSLRYGERFLNIFSKDFDNSIEVKYINMDLAEPIEMQEDYEAPPTPKSHLYSYT